MTKQDETLHDDDAATPPVSTAPLSLDRGASLGRYIVLDRLGAGGMGVVYAAYDPELDRKLAIKLLRGDGNPGSSGDRRARLVREAQALARLDHPNVVAVFDVGTFEGQVFVAMELIAGQTVRAWLAEAPRDWRSIVEVYRQAGRGLAAAHALGIVHRDFKPDNALIDKAGRVRVVDFGLARTAEDAGDSPAKPASAPDWEHEAGPAAMAAPLTRTGALIGTPGYIAPEQHAGRTPAAVDQFSLCVSLWHALYGELPFAGDSATELARAAASGEIKAPPKQTRVPAWLHRVLVRGMSADPEARFPSMNALLDALTAERTPRRELAILIAGAVIVVAIGVVSFVMLYGWSDDSMVCRGADHELAWTAARRQAVEHAFAASPAPYAITSATAVVDTLDRYASAWVAMRTDACEATRARGEQSEELLDLRMACLDDRARELAALVDVFASADGKVVEKSVQAAESLSSLAGCADTTALRTRLRASTPENRARIDELRGRLARTRALEAAGRFQPALDLAAPAVADARALHDRPIEAATLVMLGTVQKDLGDLPNAQATLEAAVVAATAARDDGAAAEAATLLVRVVGYDRANHDDGERWVERAKAFLEAHPDDRTHALLANNIGNLRFAEDRQDDALAHHNESLALRERLFGPTSPFVAASLDNIGLAYDAKGDNTTGTQYHRKALAIDEKALGSMHPLVGLTLTNLAVSLTTAGKYAEAMPIAKRALAIKEAAYGPESTMAAMGLNQIGNLEYFAGHYAQAADVFRKVIAIKIKTMNGKHPSIAASMNNLANVLERMGKLDEARKLDLDALAMKLELLPADHSDIAHSHTALGQLDLDTHAYASAKDHFDKARVIFTKAGGPDTPLVAHCWNGIADAEMGLHHTDAAIAAYQHALDIRDGKKLDVVDRGETRGGLAKALWDKGDHARAQIVAGEAEALFAEAGTRASRQHDEIVAWRASHH